MGDKGERGQEKMRIKGREREEEAMEEERERERECQAVREQESGAQMSVPTWYIISLLGL